jgi:peptidoglycan/xylan/chitin deacetylase (PgdA/CDA1 family)
MLRVLTYHRVADPRDTPMLHPGLISATPTAFVQQMGYVARHYRVVSMAEVLQAVLKGTALPRRAVLLTFDDAYHDFGDIAWPILNRYRLPVTLFVATGYPNRPERAFWWDRLYHAMTTHPILLCMIHHQVSCLSRRPNSATQACAACKIT